MEARTAGIRDVSLLTIGTAIGVVLSPALPFVGLPIAAVGLAGLAYRGHALAAAISAAVGVAAVAVLSRPDVAYAAPAVVGLLMVVALLPKWNVQAVGALLIALLTAGGIGAAELTALAEHTTLPASIAQTTSTLVADMTKALGPSATSATVAQLRETATILSAAWPWTYFESAVLVGVIIIAAVTWSARRAGRELDVPALGKLDLTPHVLWPFVVGLLLWAASTMPIASSKVLWVVGLNLVLCARTIFSLQGFAVSAGVLDRVGVRFGWRVLALAALVVLDSLMFVLSITGLLDFWVNFRRLPRDGQTSVTPTQFGV